jgi:hypothetical protein
MDWEDDPLDRAPMTEAIDTIADLRRQLTDVEANEEFLICKVNELTEALENAKLSEGYALQTVANLHKEVAELRAALEFYANPETYFAIGFFPDRPCGEFIDDFSETELGMKPGKRARAALRWEE